MRIGVTSCTMASGLTIQAAITLDKQDFYVQVFVDSRASGSIMDFKMALILAIPLENLQEPLNITAVDGSPLGSGQVTQCTTQGWQPVGIRPGYPVHTPSTPDRESPGNDIILLGSHSQAPHYPWLPMVKLSQPPH